LNIQNRIIANYNNETGVSAVAEVDVLLEKERIGYYLRKERLERERILNSKMYRLGRLILKPFSLLRKL